MDVDTAKWAGPGIELHCLFCLLLLSALPLLLFSSLCLVASVSFIAEFSRLNTFITYHYFCVHFIGIFWMDESIYVFLTVLYIPLFLYT